MSDVTPAPELAEARHLLALADAVPVVVELPVGELTPVAAMRALGVDASCFLLESVEGSGRVARWSMLGHSPTRVIRGGAGGAPDGRVGGGIDPLLELEREVASVRTARVPGIDAPFIGGAVGYLAYEAARRYERLPEAAGDPLRLPDAWFGVFDTVTLFDHARGRVLLATSVRGDAAEGLDAAYENAVERLTSLSRRLRSAARYEVPALRGESVDANEREAHANVSREAFGERVRHALEYIVAGDIFQVQVSRRFAMPLRAHPFTLYQALREINPSPYMIYIATPDCTLVGASPEMLVQVTGGTVRYHPIAGTRRRGRAPEDDARMEAELRSSEKERAEHLMLVDLGRNDLGRVCATGSVRVTQLMEVEHYSHVMHLVSSIEGTLAEGCAPVDALRACFPAGTVTGAPKIRAMEIIAELELEQRSAYAGTAGYVGFGGDLDTAITLRTIVVRDGVAYAQAAAGIVADSTVEEETLEIDNKVGAQLLAIAEANAWAAA